MTLSKKNNVLIASALFVAFGSCGSAIGADITVPGTYSSPYNAQINLGNGDTLTVTGEINNTTPNINNLSEAVHIRSVNATSISNSGTIAASGNSQALTIYNYGGASLQTITNSGTISATGASSFNVALLNYGTIDTLTNTGTIQGTGNGAYDIYAVGGHFNTINNGQGAGNAYGALKYTGTLPTNYNIIINSLTSYGKLSGSSVTGTTNFGIYNTSTLAAGTYTAVLAGLTTSKVGATRTGTYNGFNWSLALESGSSDIWDLIVASTGPNAANTLATVQQNAAGLATTYNVQAAALQAGLTYDCNTFDQYGLCASVGGRTTYGLTTPVGNQQAGLLVVSHRPDPHFRFGAFADQSVNSAMPNGIKQNNSGPMYGIFGYWNHQKDGMGLGASVSATAANSNLTITRNASLANTEAGSGNTEMQGQAVQAQATYALQATDRIKAIPYAGLRYYRVATGGYSEGSNANVTSPLTYNAMAQEVFAAVGGVGTSVFLAEKLTGTASVGIQQNLNYKMGNYQGTSTISGLESFSVNMPSNINSMATATAGVTYAIKKNEKLSLNALWQQQAFSATNTITALATYTIGF